MSKAPTKSEKEHMARVAEMGCMVCGSPAMVHHALTGGGGRRNHSKVLPLCHHHHQGAEGIHTIGRKTWQAKYGTELEMLEEVARRLGEV